MSDDYSDWFKKRKQFTFFGNWLFEDIDRLLSNMEKLMEEAFKTFTQKIPEGYVRKRKLPDGRSVHEWRPFLYGYSMKIGLDGKPQIREFGNIKQSRLGPKAQRERDPLVDIIETDREIQVVGELPGVEKKDVKLRGTEDTITISVDTPNRKYYKRIVLPAKVDLRKTDTAFKNGVLEIKFHKIKKKKPEGELISIE